MDVIYLDRLFGLNLLLDYCLMRASARVCGVVLRRGRYLLAALTGALYAALMVRRDEAHARRGHGAHRFRRRGALGAVRGGVFRGFRRVRRRGIRSEHARGRVAGQRHTRDGIRPGAGAVICRVLCGRVDGVPAAGKDCRARGAHRDGHTRRTQHDRPRSARQRKRPA